jgi:hypothetical protein
MALGTAESAAVLLVLLGNISAWSKMIYDARKNGRNGTGKPCPLHEPLTKELETLHKENREEHLQISKDIKDLSISIAGAAAAAATAAAAVATVGKGKR